MIKYHDSKLLAQQNPELGLDNPGLSSHLSGVRNGSAPTPRSWLYEDVAPESCFNKVETILNDLKGTHSRLVADDLYYTDKFGPQGGAEEWTVNRLPLLEQSFAHQEPSPVFETQLWKDAKTKVIQKLKFRKNLRPKSAESVVESLRKKGGLSTNSGLPDFTRRSTVVDKAIADSKNGNWKKYPAVIGMRSIRGSERNIYMYPFSTNIQGSRFQQVVQDYIRSLKLPEFAAWEGMDEVTLAINPYMGVEYYKLSSDYSKMDNNFRLQHTQEVFDVVKHAFQPQYWEELRESMEHTHTIPILTPDGITIGNHGVASGSEWTNFLETLFQSILWTYITLKRESANKAPIARVLFLGDDAAAFSTDPITDDFIEAAEAVKFIANREKQHESTTEVHYLRRWYYNYYRINNICVGVYPLTLNINSQIFPERFHDPRKWSGSMFVIRSLMILENSNFHPGFDPYADYVLRGNSKHFREFAKLSPQQVALEEKKARDIAGFVPSYNQEKIDRPLSEYRSYKKLLEIYS